jgi:hypothetical protein
MKLKNTLMTMLAAMLAVTSAFADQASLVAELRANPTEDFSGKTDGERNTLAGADAIVYSQDHKGTSIDFNKMSDIGTAHAFKHHLLGEEAVLYMMVFRTSLKALLADSQ